MGPEPRIERPLEFAESSGGQGSAWPVGHNPYAPPAHYARRRRRSKLDRTALVILGLYATSSIAAFAADASVLGGESTTDGGAPRLVAVCLLLLWLGRRWAALPAEAQKAVAGKRIGPWLAVLFHFLPGFDVFWLFKAQVALRDGVNGCLGPKSLGWAVPRPPAVLAPLGHLCSIFWFAMLRTSWFYLLPAALTPTLWVVHIGLIERAWAHRRRTIIAPEAPYTPRATPS